MLEDSVASVFRAELAAETKRHDDLREMSREMLEKLMTERLEFQRELRDVEKNRLDANAAAESQRLDSLIEGVKNDVALAAAKADLTAVNLAERVDTSAKVLAQSQVDTAAALRAAAENAQRTTDSRLQALEQVRFTTAGATEEQRDVKQQHNVNRTWLTAIMIFVIGQAIAIISAIFYFAMRNPKIVPH